VLLIDWLKRYFKKEKQMTPEQMFEFTMEFLRPANHKEFAAPFVNAELCAAIERVKERMLKDPHAESMRGFAHLLEATPEEKADIITGVMLGAVVTYFISTRPGDARKHLDHALGLMRDGVAKKQNGAQSSAGALLDDPDVPDFIKGIIREAINAGAEVEVIRGESPQAGTVTSTPGADDSDKGSDSSGSGPYLH
jgi:hypothetical protein